MSNFKFLKIGIALALMLIALPASPQCSVSIKNKSIAQAIKIIEKSTDYSFFYAETLKDMNHKVSITAHNESIESVLNRLFAGTGITYSIKDRKQIVLSSRNSGGSHDTHKSFNSAAWGESKITVTGIVTGSDNEPLVGVTVQAGDKTGTTTDVNGNYAISLSRPSSLTFSYIGYDSRTIKVSKSQNQDITLDENNIALKDVVVIGYGTQKKIDLTGAVQSVSSKELMRRNVSTTSAALQGMVPGLTAVQSSGQPGADQANIRIRGLGSLNSSTAPLVLIDGVEGDFNRIDMNTIESVTVLKDAASASIYGSRASNGVILVTTKRGNKGKIKVDYSAYVGFNTPTTLPEPTSAIEFMQAVDVARANASQEPLYTKTIEAYQNGGVDNINYYDTNWKDAVLKDRAYMQSHSVSISGGNDVVKLFASAGYFSQEGQIANNNFSRTSLRLNSDTKLNKWMTMGLDMSIRQAKVKSPVMDTPVNIIGKALTMTPIMSGINADGTWGYGINGTNPIAMVNCGSLTNSTAPEYSAKASLTIVPFEGMNILGSYSWKRNDSETSAFVSPYKTYENGVFKGEFPTTGSSESEQRSKSISKQFNFQATYEKTFASNYIKALAGYQSEEMNYNYLLAGRKNFFYDGYNDLVNGDLATMSNSSAKYSWALLSYFFRLNYSYADKYLLEVNGRYDGTSRFMKGHRWGFFPSVSLGWRISQEKFFEPVKSVVNDLKVRASYGELGNQAINGYYPYAASVSGMASFGYWFDKNLSSGVAQTQLSNELITWEKSKQWDAGIDAALFDSRLTVGFDYYIRNITNMLQQFPVPIFVGMTAPWKNAGSMRNNGWEITLSWRNRVGDFNYYITGNLSDVRNKVINLYGKEYVGSTNITREGGEYNSWYGYVADGYFQSKDEINDPNTPVYGGNKNNVRPGYIKYKDISGPDGTPDGKIDKYDRTILGNPMPHYEYGLTIGGDWRGFDFSIFFQGVGKKDVYYQGSGARALTGNYTIYKYQLDYWTEDNRNAKFPILLEDPNGTNPNNMISSFWVKSGAYCRLKNVVLGYTLPKKLIRKATLTNVRFYASAQNLLTLTNRFYKGFDPENSIGSGASCYPLSKTFTFGLNVEF